MPAGPARHRSVLRCLSKMKRKAVGAFWRSFFHSRGVLLLVTALFVRLESFLLPSPVPWLDRYAAIVKGNAQEHTDVARRSADRAVRHNYTPVSTARFRRRQCAAPFASWRRTTKTRRRVAIPAHCRFVERLPRRVRFHICRLESNSCPTARHGPRHGGVAEARRACHF